MVPSYHASLGIMFTQCYPDSCNPDCIWIEAYLPQVSYTLFTPILCQVYSLDEVHTPAVLFVYMVVFAFVVIQIASGSTHSVMWFQNPD